MIRGTKMFSHRARCLHSQGSRRFLVPLTTQASAGASNTDRWSGGRWAIGAASVSVLGMGLAAQIRADADGNPAVANCESSDETLPWRMDEAGGEGGEGQGEGKTLLEVIPFSQLSVKDDGGRSERAFASAVENGLFDTYEDGADDWEEVDEEDIDRCDAVRSEPAGEDVDAFPSANAVTEHFVSFSPMPASVNVKPRMSHRHTSRRASEKEEVKRTRFSADDLLATSDAAAAPACAEGGNNSLLNRITTVRRNGLGHDQVYTQKMYFYQSSQIKNAKKKFRLRLFALPSSQKIGREMAYLLGTSLNCIDVGAFNDGETSVKIDDMVRGKEVYVVCATTSTRSIVELLLTISALRRASAKRICAVLPHYGYSRQDRRSIGKRVSGMCTSEII